MWQPSNFQWWILVVVALLVVAAWPSGDDKSLALKFVNWAVDRNNELPTLPGELDMASGDDADAVQAHDSQENAYYDLYDRGGWMRRRLLLKVAGEPLNPATERQMLAGVGVAVAFLVWRFAGAKK